MITFKSCPICDSHLLVEREPRVATPLNEDYEIMPGVKLIAAVLSHYYICQDCHLIFQNPRMTDRELNKFYSQGYYFRMVEMTEEEMDETEAHRAKIDTQIIRQYIGNVYAHLDVGCGRGHLLDLVDATIRVGIEANMNNVKIKGVKIYSKIDKVPHKTFDLVTAIHVLEHVSKPLDYLKKMAKLVNKNGHLIVEVPTWKSPGGSLRLPHLYHFEPDVLRVLCKKAGLYVIHVGFTPHLILICKTHS